jgi:NACHT domain
MARTRESLWIGVGSTAAVISVGLASIAGALDAARAHYALWSSTPMIAAYASFGLAIGCLAGAVRDWPFPLATGRSAEQSFISSRRWWPTVAGVCVVIATASVLLVAWAPGQFRIAATVVGAVACLAAIVVSVSGVVTWLRSLKRLDPAVRRLLDAQLSEADFHQYKFGSLSLPGVSLIYVEQHLGGANAERNSALLLDVKEFVQRTPKAIVIGVPGAGKSTLAAHVVGTAARWWTEARIASRASSSPFGRLIPVMIPAKALVENDIPAALGIRWSQAGVDAQLFLRDPFRKAKWLVIVDSLDEISSSEARTRVIQRLGSFASSAKAHLIVTTRALTAGELADLTGRRAQEFYLRLFGSEELLTFASNWFSVRGGGHVDGAAEAARFIGHVRSSALESIVRVPLLATMAILVYEGDRDRALPTSRSALYEEFIWLLRGAREATPSTPFEQWLTDNLGYLLRELACAYVQGNRRKLLADAIAWVVDRAPSNLLTEPESERLGSLRNSLITSGLCVFAPSQDTDGDEPGPTSVRFGRFLGNDVEFVHLTIAEYLASDPTVYNFAYETFRSLMADGSTRGFALFTLARSSADPSEIVRSLLEEDDPLSAGRIVADGIPVTGEARRQTVNGLFNRVASDHPTAFECVSLLADLAAAPDVLTRLCAFVNDKRQTSWARAVFADALADLDAKMGLDLLKRLVRDSQGSQSGAIWWARQRLDSRGAAGSPSVAPDRFITQSAKSLSGIGRQACRGTAMDKSRPAKVRAEAANILHTVGDDVGTQVLHALVVDERVDANLRLDIARTLSASHDEQGDAALRALALADGSGAPRVSVEIRRAAASGLMSRGDPAGAKVLQELARDYRLPMNDRRQIAAQLVERDDPIGRETLARLDREHALRTARIRFGGLALVVVPLVTLSAGALLSGKAMATTALVGLACITIVTVWQFLGAAPGRARAMTRQTRPSPLRAYTRRSRPGGLEYLEYLAASVSRDLTDNQAASGGGELIRTYLARRYGHETHLLPWDLTDVLIRAPGSPILILGPPGSGKTQAATKVVLDYLARREEGDVVPVLLSLRSWSASDRSLEDWMVESLANHYAIAVDEIKPLFVSARILPVLDGLDEIIPDQQRVVASEIYDMMARRGNSLIVTCRSRDYADLGDLVGKVDVIDHATLYDMQPVQPRDVISFIRHNTTEEQLKAWTPIIRELEVPSPGPFAELMASPLTATLTLQPYLKAGRNPGQLLRQIYSRGRSSADLGLGNVWEDYLSTAIDGIPRYSPENSRRWLRTIADYMQSEGVREFRWWDLRKFAPARLMFIITLLAIAVPPVIAVIMEVSIGTVPPPTVVAGAAVVVGLLTISTQEPTRLPHGETPGASVRGAIVGAWLQAAALASGCALLAYAGRGKPSALIVAVAAAGCFWTTHAGRFLLSRVYFARLTMLPWSLMSFLDEATRAGITIYDGPAYRFVRNAIQEDLLRAR